MVQLYDLRMKRQLFVRALTSGVAAVALFFAGCSTTESRISDHPEIYQSLSPNDQALVSQGQIRAGMSQNAVWLAWGSPEQKAVGDMRGRPTETWVYVTYTSAYPYAYPYHGYGRFYGGFGFVGISGGRHHHHHHRSFVFFGDPFYDPFFYSYIPPSIPVPYRTVTFSNGRVVSFQYLVAPYR
jgi:hypothetical protein